MRTKKRLIARDLNELVTQLTFTSAEIEAIGHLIKWQQPEIVPSERIQAAIGATLEKLGRRVMKITNKLDQIQYGLTEARRCLPDEKKHD